LREVAFLLIVIRRHHAAEGIVEFGQSRVNGIKLMSIAIAKVQSMINKKTSHRSEYDFFKRGKSDGI